MVQGSNDCIHPLVQIKKNRDIYFNLNFNATDQTYQQQDTVFGFDQHQMIKMCFFVNSILVHKDISICQFDSVRGCS